ncbi:unnamed protein product [Rotaria socialis]|uniref:LTD domain-containing protein n=1 Tax=Rotaria socialis TaxID=392032 RepID=A0A820M2I1_9BILA|nr:unnamed protein product [Rotaria socialis]CAF4365976.1 unnamed protein product [Rotaria socialis]
MNGENLNGFENSNTTINHRTLVEHGTGRIVNGTNSQNGPTSAISTIETQTKQYEDEKHELQELNYKFAMYLDHVRDLENFNGQLLVELESLKRKWGNDVNQLHVILGLQLGSVRDTLDDGARDNGLQELELKRHEDYILIIRQRIATFESDIKNQLNEAQQKLNVSSNVLEQLRSQYEQNSKNLDQQRTVVNNLSNEYDTLESELVDHKLKRIMVGNELQTLRERAAFQHAIHKIQSNCILALDAPAIDLSNFYHTELIRAIGEIRHDFEVFAKSQTSDLEEYYRIKTQKIEEIARENQRKRALASENAPVGQGFDLQPLTSLENDHSQLKSENDKLEVELNRMSDDLRRIQDEQIARENQRKRALASENAPVGQGFDLQPLTCLENDHSQLKSENDKLEVELNRMSDDLRRIQDERRRENNKLDEQSNQLRQELGDKQATIDGVLENNVSLRFELSTYRALLNFETQRVNRANQGDELNPSSSRLDALLSRLDPTSSRLITASSQLDSSSSVSLPPPSSFNQKQSNSIRNTENNPWQKMKIQSIATDPIVIHSVDLINDCVIIMHNESTVKPESLKNWTIHRLNDQQAEIVCQLPWLDLKPGQKLRVLSKSSSQSTKTSDSDVLFVDNIGTWGRGQVMKTILLNSYNEEMGSITQTCISA